MHGLRTISDPTSHRGIRIPGALVLAPINTGFATNGLPDNRLVQFHRMRAGPGIGIGFVGNVATDLSVRTNNGTVVLADDESAAVLGNIAQAIKSRGSLAGIQLGDSPKWLLPPRVWRASNVDCELNRLRQHISSVTASELQHILDRFVASASLAVKAEFSVVEIHAAHGYSLSLLLEPAINQRTDAFGSDGEWLERFCCKLRLAIGDPTLLAFRISSITGLRSRAADIKRTIVLWRRLAEHGIDILDISAGLYSVNRQMIYPKQSNGPAYLDVALALAATASNPIITTGGIRDLNVIQEIPRNILIGLGRPLLADPMLVTKYLEGRSDTIVPCCSSGRCHFGTLGQPNIACGQNPKLATTGE